MKQKAKLSRRQFVGGLATAAAYFCLPERAAWAQNDKVVVNESADNYDSLVKLCYNENPYGPPESVLQAMTRALKYANRYGYPDGNIVEKIAAHHGAKPENVLLGAGSTEILQMAAETFLPDRKQVIGADPTFQSVFEFATGQRARSIRLPLTSNFRQDIPAMIKTAKENASGVGFIYICNPNNPTGVIVSKGEVKLLLDGLPENVPVLMDEAYHHFVDDPNYATSVPLAIEGRPVIVARTFSKIAALAGMRLGYAIAPANLAAKMRAFAGTMTTNVLAKHAGVAALADTAALEKVRGDILHQRKQTMADLAALGFRVIPSQGNFFMVNIRQNVMPVIQAFRKQNILVGRPFPPMLEYLRVSIGTADDMARFLRAFKEIVLPTAK
ncbi:MAG TPA: aminotransferase class I/II-fold pyridoxal phosphate-dependent enzyme [Verrucomicrobiae bacterium]